MGARLAFTIGVQENIFGFVCVRHETAPGSLLLLKLIWGGLRRLST